MTVTFNLPFPPSVNSMWRSKGSNWYSTPKYKAWQKEAFAEIKYQKVPKVKPPYSITIAAGRPDKRKRDIGNLEKGVSDILQTAGIITNDCDTEHLEIYWDCTIDAGRINVTISTIGKE